MLVSTYDIRPFNAAHTGVKVKLRNHISGKSVGLEQKRWGVSGGDFTPDRQRLQGYRQLPERR